MDLIHGKHKASKFDPGDFISSMPDNVITNILHRLSLQEAVRTDILSRKWRFKWTMLSQLVLDDNFFRYLITREDKNNHMRIINRLLLFLRGDVTKCVLFIDNRVFSEWDIEDINHWILFLSRNGIKDLTIRSVSPPIPKLPTHLFSCLGLTHLKLFSCSIHPPTSFSGFPNLLSLELLAVQCESRQFGQFITRCPVLEILKLNVSCKVKLNEIAQPNLKTLSLFLCNLEYSANISSSTIFELLGFLPKLQELHLDFLCCAVIEGGAKERLTNGFPCLKALKLTNMDFHNAIMLSCVFETIRHLPSLETLEIIACYHQDNTIHPICSPEVDDNTTEPMQLRNARFIDLEGSENEVWLMNYLLACSPFVKKIAIHPHQSVAPNKQLMFATKLLKLQRAYPLVDIGLY